MHATSTLLQNSSPSNTAKTPRNFRWRVVDIVVASIIGVASGLIFVVWNQASNPLGGLLTPLLPGLQGLLGGGWLFAGVLGGLIIRKPGAALYTELLAAVVSTLIGGNAWGPLVLVSGLTQGLGAELVFALFLYGNYRAYVALLAGAGAGIALTITDLLLWYPGASATFMAIYLAASIISGVVVAGLLSWLALKGIARTGALSRFASGRDATAVV
ncbi:ECF transporter S component [Cryobacterium frigoriphilum]|uniref:ECF transporter S component n=1 Tax=Cryobacterium frigoriphilum TaxID=1259150 RepID=UPI0018E086D2